MRFLVRYCRTGAAAPSAASRQPLVDLDHLTVQQLGQHDVPVE